MFYKLLFVFLAIFSSLNAIEDIKNLRSFKADFSQIIDSSNGNKINYTGEVYIKDDGKILWKYKTPIIKNVYILKDYAIVDEPELEQAIITNLESEINIIELLNKSNKIDEKTYVSKIEDVDYLIGLENNKIHTIKYKDKLDNKVIITFNDSIENTNLSEEIFKFSAPDYYDIIRK